MMNTTVKTQENMKAHAICKLIIHIQLTMIICKCYEVACTSCKQYTKNYKILQFVFYNLHATMKQATGLNGSTSTLITNS